MVSDLPWVQLLAVYGPALVGSWIALGFVWNAWTRERQRNRVMVERAIETLAETTRVLGEVLPYMRDLRDQGIRAVTREPPS